MDLTPIYVLTKPSQRGPNHCFYALNKDHEMMEATIFASSKKTSKTLANKLHARTYALLRNATKTTREGIQYLRLNADTAQVFKAGEDYFQIPQEVLTAVFNPPEVSVPEALASPKKRKISIEAEIVEVKAVKTGDSWTRRDIIIQDEATSKRISVKLWNESSNLVREDSTGSRAHFRNLEVDFYNNRVQLKTLDMTTIEIMARSDSYTGEYEIIGVDDDEDPLTIIIADGRTIEMKKSYIESSGYTIEEFVRATPFKAELEVESGSITKIIFPQKPAKKSSTSSSKTKPKGEATKK